MRGQQAGSWAMFHSQNQDPPRSTSCLASQAPSPVASPLRWQGTVWCLSQGARRPGPRRGSRLPTRWAHFSLWSPPPRLAWIQGGRKRRNRCPAGHQLLNPATRPLPGRCLTVCREPRQAGQCHLVFTRCRSWSPSVLVTSAPGQTPEGALRWLLQQTVTFQTARYLPCALFAIIPECLGRKPGCETCSGERGTGPCPEVGR
ncbi:uncharacterized protein LOC107195621 isoform X4 [Pteropus alecto]|uniref:uncharacterized protein LOC107195621 isoform X4 n=1 Tax=Pteropus alecto TaxID=9402 RepID=UPI000D53551D|nr:uncharacterized protein LOC107195621 isoform X4 [Pteropus alecto]